MLGLIRRTRDPMLLTAGAGMAARLARPLVALVTLPFLFAYLGPERLGIWLITLSLFIIFGFVSSGLSVAIVTAISQAAGRYDAGASKGGEISAIIVAGYVVAISWALASVALLVPVALLGDWSTWLGAAMPGPALSCLFATSAALIGGNIVSMLPRFVMLARGHGGLAFSIETLGIVLSGASLIFAIIGEASMPALLVAFFLPAMIVETIGGMIYFAKANLEPRAGFGEAPRHIGMLFREGTRMLGYHTAFGVSSNSDTLIIGLILGPAASAVYGIASRVFSLPILLAYAINTAQWPVFAKAFTTGDVSHVQRVFQRTAATVTIVASGTAVGLALFYDPILQFWIDQPEATPPSLLLVMIAWVFVAVLVNCCDSVLKAKADTRFLLACALSMSVINLAMTLVLLPLIGVAGAVLGTLIGYIFAMLLPFVCRLRNIFSANTRAIAGSVPGDIA